MRVAYYLASNIKKRFLNRKTGRVSARQLWFVAMAVVLSVSLVPPLPAAAATLPATVSADPLPTVQIDGIVWKQALHGNTVYATGQFTTARPAGVAKGGAGTVTRNGLIAYDITTGNINTSFVHSLTGGKAMGKAISVSPDGKRLYVGGSFTTVDGQARNNFAVFDLTTNKLLGGSSGTNGQVSAIAATNTMAYVGGSFSTAGGLSRSKLAAYSSDGTINANWKADVTGTSVTALAATKTQGNLVVGGSFNKINGATYYSLGAVKLTNGANVPWASQSNSFPIRMQAPDGIDPSRLGITSLSVDATQVYLTAFTFVAGARPASFEGRAAISASDGKLIWVNDCIGDSYDAVPIGQVLYSVNHSHKCSVIGGYPEQAPQRALAETTYVTGKNMGNNGGNYPSFDGQPSTTLLNWFPVLNTGTVSGSNQAAWSIVGNSDYIALGGEFTKAGTMAQQGLVRYAVRSKAPNKVGPMAYTGQYHASGYSLAVAAHPADATGKALVRVYVTGDPDDTTLTYHVYRKGSSQVVASKTMGSTFWQTNQWAFYDTGVTPGQSLQYALVVEDPNGNKLTVADPTFMNENDARIVYSKNGSVSDWTSSIYRPATTPDLAASISHASRNGAYYTFTFTGTSIKILAEKGPTRGKAAVSIDGGPATTIEMNDPNRRFQQTVFSKSGLPSGTHTIKVTKVDGQYIDLDGIIVR